VADLRFLPDLPSTLHRSLLARCRDCRTVGCTPCSVVFASFYWSRLNCDVHKPAAKTSCSGWSTAMRRPSVKAGGRRKCGRVEADFCTADLELVALRSISPRPRQSTQPSVPSSDHCPLPGPALAARTLPELPGSEQARLGQSHPSGVLHRCADRLQDSAVLGRP
jgi:hypothetical protein